MPLTVAPLRFGTGLKGKVLESFACGLPWVKTSADVLKLTGSVANLVAEASTDLARRIVQLLADKIGNQGRTAKRRRH